MASLVLATPPSDDDEARSDLLLRSMKVSQIRWQRYSALWMSGSLGSLDCK